MELMLGLEPRTGRLQGCCATVAPHQHIWGEVRESNTKEQGHNLPVYHQPNNPYMVGEVGADPTTPEETDLQSAAVADLLLPEIRWVYIAIHLLI